MNKHILIVDDEPYILAFLSDLIKGTNIQIGTALNGELALDYIKTHNVDLVITDIMMPQLNGIELFYAIKKYDPFIQVVIITGYPSLNTIAEMLEAGANDFLIKPFDASKLKSVVEEAFNRIERWRALRHDWIASKGKKK